MSDWSDDLTTAGGALVTAGGYVNSVAPEFGGEIQAVGHGMEAVGDFAQGNVVGGVCQTVQAVYSGTVGEVASVVEDVFNFL
jgi:hypothetical protein